MVNKIFNLEEAVNLVEDGMVIGLGGNVLHRAPMSFVREISRQNKKNLKVVKTAGGHDIDLLSAFKNIESVDAGFVGYETKFGLAKYYRKAVQNGEIKANEHACYTVISALRASKIGVGFMPVKGMKHGDLIKNNDYFKKITDPFTGQEYTVVKAIEPDVSVIHVHECDINGNAYIYGPIYDDVLLANSSKKVIITTENIISDFQARHKFDEVKIPGFLVDAIVHVPNGAKPCSCHNLYDIDSKRLKEFLDGDFEAYMDSYEIVDRRNMGGKNVFKF